MPIAEMERLQTLAEARADGAWVAYAFTEQGTATLREVVLGLLGEPIEEILFVPLLLPMEPAFAAWLTKTLERWRAERPGPWPQLRIGSGIGEGRAIADLLAEQISAAREASSIPQQLKAAAAGSLVPAQKRRVLVCQGFQDRSLEIGPLAVIGGVGHERDVVAGLPGAPTERACADGRGVEGRRIGIGRLLQDVLRHDEGVGQQREIGRESALHAPGNLIAGHPDVAHERMPDSRPDLEARRVDELERVFHIRGGERDAVMPGHAVAQLHLPCKAAIGNSAIRFSGDLHR